MNLHLFNTNVPIVFDDIRRMRDSRHMRRVAATLSRDFEVIGERKKYRFGVIR